MRRRTRPRVVWLPQTNANSIGPGSVYQLGIIEVGGTTGTSATDEIPLVLDRTPEALGVDDASLSDIHSSGYRLRRIVGKLWVEMSQFNIPQIEGVDAVASVIVSAGIMVRRSDPTAGTSFASTAGQDEIDVGLIQNTMDPWVWRRSWTLGNNGATQLVSGAVGSGSSRQFFPTQNWASYGGGISEGPHIDQKTARIVSSEERLFLDVTVTVLGEAPDPGLSAAATIAYWTDIRVLGSLVTNTGNRRNASR